MKMWEIYASDLVRNCPELKDKIHDLIQKHYPHLRHSLRGSIDIDESLMDEIFKVMEDNLT